MFKKEDVDKLLQGVSEHLSILHASPKSLMQSPMNLGNVTSTRINNSLSVGEASFSQELAQINSELEYQVTSPFSLSLSTLNNHYQITHANRLLERNNAILERMQLISQSSEIITINGVSINTHNDWRVLDNAVSLDGELVAIPQIMVDSNQETLSAIDVQLPQIMAAKYTEYAHDSQKKDAQQAIHLLTRAKKIIDVTVDAVAAKEVFSTFNGLFQMLLSHGDKKEALSVGSQLLDKLDDAAFFADFMNSGYYSEKQACEIRETTRFEYLHAWRHALDTDSEILLTKQRIANVFCHVQFLSKNMDYLDYEKKKKALSGVKSLGLYFISTVKQHHDIFNRQVRQYKAYSKNKNSEGTKKLEELNKQLKTLKLIKEYAQAAETWCVMFQQMPVLKSKATQRNRFHTTLHSTIPEISLSFCAVTKLIEKKEQAIAKLEREILDAPKNPVSILKKPAQISTKKNRNINNNKNKKKQRKKKQRVKEQMANSKPLEQDESLTKKGGTHQEESIQEKTTNPEIEKLDCQQACNSMKSAFNALENKKHKRALNLIRTAIGIYKKKLDMARADSDFATQMIQQSLLMDCYRLKMSVVSKLCKKIISVNQCSRMNQVTDVRAWSLLQKEFEADTKTIMTLGLEKKARAEDFLDTVDDKEKAREFVGHIEASDDFILPIINALIDNNKKYIEALVEADKQTRLFVIQTIGDCKWEQNRERVSVYTQQRRQRQKILNRVLGTEMLVKATFNKLLTTQETETITSQSETPITPVSAHLKAQHRHCKAASFNPNPREAIYYLHSFVLTILDLSDDKPEEIVYSTFDENISVELAKRWYVAWDKHLEGRGLEALDGYLEFCELLNQIEQFIDSQQPKQKRFYDALKARVSEAINEANEVCRGGYNYVNDEILAVNEVELNHTQGL